MDYRNLRRVRGVKSLCEYLTSINCPMSESTIYRLIRTKRIPHIRPSKQILIFDLDAIDRWLSIEEV
ncbi:helix-turn-helix transcriptional regulator [Sporosarcina sp. FSL W7-1283]|uniref:helix-turn-helix transcriptional regulator n=1 Tax=Sporosarcina sp. FSL W7-1283 TaxID=2921560 RepID=UPI0030F6D9F0